jgi:hypothetical protein
MLRNLVIDEPPIPDAGSRTMLDHLRHGHAPPGPLDGSLIAPQCLPGTTTFTPFPPPAPFGGGPLPEGQVYTSCETDAQGRYTYTELWHAPDAGLLDGGIELLFRSADPFTWGQVKDELAGAGGVYAAMKFQYVRPPATLPGGDPPDFHFSGLARVSSNRGGAWQETGRMLRQQSSTDPTAFLDHFLLGPDYAAPSIAARVRFEAVAAPGGGTSLPQFLGHQAGGPFVSLPDGVPDASMNTWFYVQTRYFRTATFPVIP